MTNEEIIQDAYRRMKEYREVYDRSVFDTRDAKVGSTLRIRFPADYTIIDGPPLHIDPLPESPEAKTARLWAAVVAASAGG